MMKTPQAKNVGRNETKAEDAYSQSSVPDELRRGWLPTASIYAGMSMGGLVIGGTLASQMTFSGAMLSVLGGLTILAFLVFYPLGRIGMIEGMNSYVIGEAAFGRRGSNIACALIITAIPATTWYGVNVSVAVEALCLIFGIEGVLIKSVLCFLLGLVYIIPSLIGSKAMAKLNYMAIPLVVIISLYGVRLALTGAGSLEALMAYEPPVPISLFAGCNLVAGASISGYAFAPDYTRWQRKRSSEMLATIGIGIYPGAIALTGAGIVMGIAAANLGLINVWEPAKVIMTLGMPTFCLILVILFQWSNCAMAGYSCALAWEKLFGGKRRWWVIMTAVVGCALSVSGVIHHVTMITNLLSQFIAPVAGVILAEYYVVSGRKLDRKDGFYLPGILAWAAGCAAAYAEVFIPAVNGVIVSFVFYVIWHRVCRGGHS